MRRFKYFFLCVFSAIYSYVFLKINKIEYSRLPFIRGRVYIWNNGKIVFGEKLIINSSFRSNPVGLTKPVSIVVEKNGFLNIGDNVGLSGVTIYCSEQIEIGNNTILGGNVCLWDTDFHELNPIDRKKRNGNIKNAPIIIGEDVFIGANTMVLKGVTIGDMAVIGAGSVVSKNIPQGEIWAGNPARFIKKIQLDN